MHDKDGGQKDSNVVSLVPHQQAQDDDEGCEYCDVEELRKLLHERVDSLIERIMQEESPEAVPIAWSLLISTQNGCGTDYGTAHWLAAHVLANKLRQLTHEIESKL